ncbi:hypothetical protein ACC754_38385, partial [Rhizobium johnstonii]
AGQLSEGQIGSFAMAVWFKGISRTETVALTLAMADSGDRLQWAYVDRPIADKHSTGGQRSDEGADLGGVEFVAIALTPDDLLRNHFSSPTPQ